MRLNMYKFWLWFRRNIYEREVERIKRLNLVPCLGRFHICLVNLVEESYLITTKNVEYSYTLFELVCTDRSFDRCIVVHGMDL